MELQIRRSECGRTERVINERRAIRHYCHMCLPAHIACMYFMYEYLTDADNMSAAEQQQKIENFIEHLFIWHALSIVKCQS